MGSSVFLFWLLAIVTFETYNNSKGINLMIDDDDSDNEDDDDDDEIKNTWEQHKPCLQQCHLR